MGSRNLKLRVEGEREREEHRDMEGGTLAEKAVEEFQGREGGEFIGEAVDPSA